MFNDNDKVKRRLPWFGTSKKLLLEKMKERNESIGIYSKNKSISNLTQLRVKRSNLKKKKDEAKILWLTVTAIELESKMDADPHTAWKACKEIAAGLFKHHKSTVSMK